MPRSNAGLAGERRQLEWLRMASIVEACTLLALVGVAVPLKHLAGWPDAVGVVGPLHGVAFLCYECLVLQTVAETDWSRRELARLVGLAALPFGGFLNGRLIAGRIAALGREHRA